MPIPFAVCLALLRKFAKFGDFIKAFPQKQISRIFELP
jgi:hypothetical protein